MRVIACATVVEELTPLLPAGVQCQVFDFGRHVAPDRLKEALQDAIDAAPASARTIVLGYGLCSNAVVGLRSDACTLVVPRMDDCIGIFLASDEAYKRQRSSTPGTYYLTKGWIEAGNGPFGEYRGMVERYGQEKADWLMDRILSHYTRLALINIGQYELERYRTLARQTAEQFGLSYEEIPGSTRLLQKMDCGPWDEEFLVVPPGKSIRFADFRHAVPPSPGKVQPSQQDKTKERIVCHKS